jgi:hypothetical protein
MSEFGMKPRILFGSAGWDHADWQGPFYPDDLPVDWRLSYYANEFSVVLVPLSVWNTGDCSGWHDDVPESFRFVLDISHLPADEGALKRLKVCVEGLGDRLAGVVSWSTLPNELAGQIESEYGSDLLMKPSSDAISPAMDLGRASNSALVCLLLPDELGRDLVAFRAVMEPLLNAEGPCRAVMFFFSGEPPAIKVMKDAEVLCQLLGGM